MSWKIHQGDVREVLRTLPDASAQTCVTSPPYWGLRDYGTEGQIGLEKTPAEYVEAIVAVFREVRRVLKDDGTLWLNLGDCYATGAGSVGNSPGGGAQGERWKGGAPSDKSTLRGNGHVGGGPKLKTLGSVPVGRGVHTPENSGKAGPRVAAMGPMTQPNRMPQPGLKPKDLVGIPWRVAFALQADGWWLRSDIVWSKPNPMPESVRDRPTKSHEYVFLLTKAERYYYDAAAIRTPAKWPDGPNSPESIKSPYGQGFTRKADKQRGHSRRHAGFNERWDKMPFSEQMAMGANARSVWDIATTPYSEAHFATFPEALPERCIKAGSRPGDTVLDPFTGAGTTGLVADRLGRDFVGIELNPGYLEMARKRIASVTPLFVSEAQA